MAELFILEFALKQDSSISAKKGINTMLITEILKREISDSFEKEIFPGIISFVKRKVGLLCHVNFCRANNDNHGYRFGRPHVVVCSTCEELEAKIKSLTLN